MGAGSNTRAWSLFAPRRGVATTVQRYWRGYLGRLRAQRALEEHNRALRQAYFDAKATVVQKWWRGYFSRKNVHDYYARKAYLRAVRERNEDIRSELAMEAERALTMQRQVRRPAPGVGQRVGGHGHETLIHVQLAQNCGTLGRTCRTGMHAASGDARGWMHKHALLMRICLTQCVTPHGHGHTAV